MGSEMEEIIDAKLRLMLVDCQELLAVVESYPELVKNGTEEIYSYIEALKKALVKLPEEFDISYTRKINQILDIAQELDKHSSRLEEMLGREIPRLLREQEERLESKCKPPYWLMFLLCAFASCIGGGLVVAAIVLI
ncbi:hypothetical protein ABMY12_20885 [Vibrio vulnificus]|uniref:hypothetical protein n=1 Tax=Vibrio vulnificus TaxID=672 RepID=UPI00405878EC